jgi:hypothetical protein
MKKVLVISLFLFLVGLPAKAQTYLGAINGTVTDPSGAVVPGASVKATNKATGIDHATVSTSDGGFVFQDLPVGAYSVVVTAAGFPVTTIEGVLVEQGAVYTLPVSLKISQAATSVEVSAAALSLDTTSETQTTLVGGADLQQMPLNGRDFSQLISVAPGFAGYSAGGFGSLNGTRANQINWQIDGVDNNDLWHNIPAVNQGGVSDIAGIVLPIDSIDQFSVQTQAAPESGRNPGGTVDLALKSGGNDYHGSAYFYIRNEAFAAASPFVDSKKENRNQQYGFSVGGPVLKDRFTKRRKTRGIGGPAAPSPAAPGLSRSAGKPRPSSSTVMHAISGPAVTVTPTSELAPA